MPPQLAAIRPTTRHRHLAQAEVDTAACTRDAVQDVIAHERIILDVTTDRFGRRNC